MTPVELAVVFASRLRRAGVAVPVENVQVFVSALSLLGVKDPELVGEAGIAALVKRPQDIDRYWAVFGELFGSAIPCEEFGEKTSVIGLDGASDDDAGDDGEEFGADRVVRYSHTEQLRQADLAKLSLEERAEALHILETFRWGAPQRRSRRLRPGPGGQIDLRRTLRRSVATLGDPIALRRRNQGIRPRRMVFLLDISGSMASYAPAMLRLAWSAHRGLAEVEVLTIGTQLTWVTPALAHLDPDRALAEAGRRIQDWSGGTSIGESIWEFTSRYGSRGMARGSVVVIFSDGWDRGDPGTMAAAMKRLSLLAYRVVWVNPLAGSDTYTPVARGMAAALPSLDALLAGESVASLEEVARLVCRIGGRREGSTRTGACLAAVG